jgi:hypothetical protein
MLDDKYIVIKKDDMISMPESRRRLDEVLGVINTRRELNLQTRIWC